MAEVLRIAIVGAESTGKTTLAVTLVERLKVVAGPRGLRVTGVSEVLREWCDAQGRTPLLHEQAAIAEEQHARIESAAARHDIVVSDTTAAMTTIYSRLVFGDRSLDLRAAELHRRMSLTLLTVPDLPWQADGLQRDGPHVQAPVDRLLRAWLAQHGLPYALVSGHGEKRTAAALAAVQPALAQLTERDPGG
jgi:nicotinamide riboside kinase